MNSFTFTHVTTRLLLATLAVLFVSAAGDHGLPHGPPAHNVCYKKIQKCCFKHVPCGFIVKKVNIAPRCDFKRCEKVCKKACKLVPHKHPRKTCAFTKVYKNEKCGHFLTHVHGKPVVTKKCFAVYGFKKQCFEEVDVLYKEVCVKVCAPICTLEKAVCTKTDVFHYPKFCAKVGCAGVVTEGSTVAPESYVGKEKKLVKEVGGRHEVIGVEPITH